MKSTPRPREVAHVQGLLRRHRVVSILGPRQCGKTTLAQLVLARARGEKLQGVGPWGIVYANPDEDPRNKKK